MLVRQGAAEEVRYRQQPRDAVGKSPARDANHGGDLPGHGGIHLRSEVLLVQAGTLKTLRDDQPDRGLGPSALAAQQDEQIGPQPPPQLRAAAAAAAGAEQLRDFQFVLDLGQLLALHQLQPAALAQLNAYQVAEARAAQLGRGEDGPAPPSAGRPAGEHPR